MPELLFLAEVADPVSNPWVQLGIAAPIVAALLYLLKRQSDEHEKALKRQTDESQAASEERRQITEQFLEALKTTVEQSNEARLRSANELSQLTLTIRDQRERSADEHQRIVDAIGKLNLRERS